MEEQMTPVVISNLEQAFAFLSEYQDTTGDVPDFKIEGDIARFTADIDGEKYKASVPAELARGLWEFQSELYRAVAFALYGVDNIAKLTAEQRTDFELTFHVTEGSTALAAALEKFLEKLGEGITSGIASMDSKDKKISIIAVAIVLALAFGGTTLIENQGDVKKEEVKAQVEMDKEAQKTAQFELFAKIANSNQIASRFTTATAEGTKAIVKGASDADTIRVGKVTYNREEIQEVTQRAAKEKATAHMLSQSFVIIQAQFREQTSTKIWLAAEGVEFPVVVLDEDFDADSLKKLWDAAQNRKPISLEVNVTKVRGQIKSGVLVRVI